MNNPKVRNHTRSSNGYQVKYVKIFDTRRFQRKHEAQRKYLLQTNLEKTITTLMDYIHENYEPMKPKKKLQVQKAKLSWESPSKLKNQMEELIQIFHIALIVTDYVFDFINNKQTNRLIPFCALMLSKIKKKTEFWSTMEKLLRTFPDDNSKGTDAGQKTIEAIRKHPDSIVNYLQEKKLEPELYRDALISNMNAAFDQKKNFYWKGSIQEKDMYIIRFYILSKQYEKIDSSKLLFLRQKTKGEVFLQTLRHKQLSRTHYNLAVEGEEDKNVEETINQETILDSVARLPSNGLNFYRVNNNNIPKNQSQPSNQNLEDNDSGLSEKTSHKRHREDNDDENEWSSDTSGDESRMEKSMKKIQNEYEEENAMDNGDNNSSSNNDFAHDRNTILQQKTSSAEQLYNFDCPFDEDDVERHALMLSISLSEANKQFLMMSSVQLTWSTYLHQALHRVTTLAQEKSFMTFNPDVAHLWLPSSVSHIEKKFGVLRKNHEHFQNNFQTCLEKLNVDVICNYLQLKGRQDHTRDDKRIPSFRIDVGFANHNYEKQSCKRTSTDLFRSQPKLCGIDAIHEYGNDLAANLAMLLDSMQVALDKTYENVLHLDPPMKKNYIQTHFATPMREKLGCKYFAFTNFTMSLVIIEDKKNEDQRPPKKPASTNIIPIGNSHEDNLNGEEEGNNLSLIFHLLLRFTYGTEKKIYYGRLSIIAYTRRSLESHEKNEWRLTNLKEGIQLFQRKINEQYQQLTSLHNFGNVSFSNLEKLYLHDKIRWDQINIGKESQPVNVEGLTLPVTYASEISCSAGITILRRCFLRLKNKCNNPEEKVLEVLLLAAYQGFWGRFFYAGQEMLDSKSFDWSSNLAVELATIMRVKFHGWHGGISLRGRPTNIDFPTLYSNPDTLDKAKKALKSFLVRLNDSQELSMNDYQSLLHDTTSKIPGIGEFYGQRIPLLAACAGIIFQNNLFRATFAYPVQNTTSYNAIEKLNAGNNTSTLEEDWNDHDQTLITERLDSYRLHVKPESFHKTAALACTYCNLQEHRMNWAENIFCEGLSKIYGGRSNEVHDYVFPNQSLFWIFYDKQNGYSVKEKKYNQNMWTPLID